jgi:hypothetical protein
MSEVNEEAAVNAMAAQVVYGDEDMKRDMEAFVVEAVRKALSENYDGNLTAALAGAIWQQVANYILVNKAREIEKIVARYLYNKMSGDQY